MKPTLLKIVILFLFFPLISKAQWTGIAPGPIYYNSGNVGIGTATPTSSLEVRSVGNGWLMNLRGNAVNPEEINGLKFYSGYLDDTNKWSGIATVAENLHSNLTGLALYSNANESLRITASGNVGIGTKSPLRKFTVSEWGNGSSVAPLLRLEQYNAGEPVNGTGVSIDMAIGDNYNLPNLAGQIRLVRSNYTNSSMYFSTAYGNVVSDKMTIDPYGNVGVGTVTPLQKFTVSAQGNGTAVTPLLRLEQYNPGSPKSGTGVSIDMAIGDNTNLPALAGQIRLVRSDYLNTSMYFSTALGNAIADRMVIDPNGNVGIGTDTPMGHKLAVNGDIIASAVTVKLYNNWPDYVFHPAYNLPQLPEVKNYIQKHHHLEEIPSVSEVAKKGVDLGEMNKLLLKKVEELTLYVIQQNERLQEQQAVSNSQQKIAQLQQEQIDQLKKEMKLLRN